jgi:hypothetical protein
MTSRSGLALFRPTTTQTPRDNRSLLVLPSAARVVGVDRIIYSEGRETGTTEAGTLRI